MSDDSRTALRRILTILGEDPTREGLVETPTRWLRAMSQLTIGYTQDPAEILSTTFDVEYDQMIVVRGIEFWSLCEHHILPFHGTVDVGYVPKDRVVGLSKIPRLVECFARRLQIQERLTKQIADTLFETLECQGVGVVVRAFHTCMQMRGIQKKGEMITSALLGCFQTEPECRTEFLGFGRGCHGAV